MSDKKTSDENAAGAINGADLLRGVQGGVNVKYTFTQVQTWVATYAPLLASNNVLSGTNLFTSQVLFAPTSSTAFVTRSGTGNVTPRAQTLGLDLSGSSQLLARFANDATGPRLFFAKSRGATVGAHTVVQSGDVQGSINWGASDGTNIVDGATISASVASAPGADNMPTNLKFSTNRGASTVTFSFGAYSNGFVGIGADVTPSGLLTINANTVAAATTGLAVTPTIDIIGPDATRGVLAIRSFGAAPGQIYMTGAGGTAATPTAAVVNSALGSFVCYGYATAGGAGYVSAGGFQVEAAENYTSTASGSRVTLYTVPLTTTTVTAAARFQPSGGFSVGATAIATDPGLGNLSVTNAIQLGSFTVGTLPAGVNGRQVYCSNGRMYNGAGVLEGAGAGTGGMVSYNGAWKIVGTNQTVQA